MQDIEEQWLQHFRILVHPLKVEALKTRESNRVFGIVKNEIELPTRCPFGEPVCQAAVQGVRQNGKRPKCWLDFIQVFDLAIEVAFLRGGQLQRCVPLNQNLEEKGKKIEILLGGWHRKGVDLEAGGVQPDADIGASKEPRETLETATQVEDEGIRVVLLEVRDEKIQEERFARSRAAQNHGVRHVSVMKIQEVWGVVVGFEHREIFLSQVPILRLTAVKGKEERVVGIIGVEQIHRAEIES